MFLCMSFIYSNNRQASAPVLHYFYYIILDGLTTEEPVTWECQLIWADMLSSGKRIKLQSSTH